MKKDNFEKLKYPIHQIPHGTDLLHKFPELSRHKVFAEYGREDRNKVIRYIMYVYDMNSDLIESCRKLSDRKEKALELAGFKRRGKKWPEHIDQLLKSDFQKQLVVPIFNMITCFLMEIQNNLYWTEICVLEQEYHEFMKLRMDPVSSEQDKDTIMAAERKTKLREACEKIIEKIAQHKEKVFGDNEDIQSEIKKIRVTSPEKYAKFMSI